MWSIGKLRLDGRVVLGPMSGYTFESYREFMRPFGAGIVMTEMVSAVGLVHGQDRSDSYVRFDGEGATGVQLFGSDPDTMAEGLLRALDVNPRISLFDVNMGCPVPKVLRSRSGSALMGDPKLCGRIVRAMKDATDIPVTAKIRLGKDTGSMNFREVIDQLVRNDVDAITIHARTVRERYTGRPHYDVIKGLGSEIPVPLIVSGNIFSVSEAKQAMETSDAQGVMVARGGVGNPFLVTQIDTYLRTGDVLPNPTVSEQVGWCIRLMDMMVDGMGEEMTLKKVRSFAPKFIAGIGNCREYRRRLTYGFENLDDVRRIMQDIGSEIGDLRILELGRAPSDLG